MARHPVSGGRIAQALDDITGRTWRRWHGLRYVCPSLEKLKEMRDELLDHVAARTVEDSVLGDEQSRLALTAAECSLGVLSVESAPSRMTRSRTSSDIGGRPGGRSGGEGRVSLVCGVRFEI